jgi:hypothetical protein
MSSFSCGASLQLASRNFQSCATDEHRWMNEAAIPFYLRLIGVNPWLKIFR